MTKDKLYLSGAFKDPTASSRWSIPGKHEQELINMSLEEMIEQSTIRSPNEATKPHQPNQGDQPTDEEEP